MLNVHHLELFYYIARYEGIVAACRQMPYGIQQPAMSAQVGSLEKELGVRLFERRPFRLTEAGGTLYDFIAPFFGRLTEVEEGLRGSRQQLLRLAGLTEVMRGHVPRLLAGLRERFPGLKFTLHEIEQRGAEQLIEKGEADIAVTVLESRLAPGFRSITLARLPLCLLVPAEERRSAEQLLKAADQPLISLPGHEMLPRMFQAELARRKLSWTTSMEASSQDLVSIYVRNGLGVGLAVVTPEVRDSSEFRVLRLKGFPALPIGTFWRGQLSEVGKTFVQVLEKHSQGLLGK
ncbi:LysR family transcriptional regulator [soil metagenome]